MHCCYSQVLIVTSTHYSLLTHSHTAIWDGMVLDKKFLPFTYIIHTYKDIHINEWKIVRFGVSIHVSHTRHIHCVHATLVYILQ